MAGRRPVVIEMDVKSREGLQDLVRRHSSPQQLVKRAQIILEAADGKNHSQVARELKISMIWPDSGAIVGIATTVSP